MSAPCYICGHDEDLDEELPAVGSVWFGVDKRTSWRVRLLVPGAQRAILLAWVGVETSCADRQSVSVAEFAARFAAVVP